MKQFLPWRAVTKISWRNVIDEKHSYTKSIRLKCERQGRLRYQGEGNMHNVMMLSLGKTILL